jgi:hypothetical protein
MNNTELHELIPLHALNALEPHHVPLLEAYLKAHPEAQASYVWYLEAVTVLARAIPLEEPPEDLKARTLDRVRLVNALSKPVPETGLPQAIPDLTEPTRPSRVPNIPAAPGRSRASQTNRGALPGLHVLPIAFSAMAMAVIVGLVILNLQTTRRLTALEASEKKIERLLASSQTTSAVMTTPDGKLSIGKVFVGRDGLLLISHSMQKLPNGKTWQAWYFLEGETAPRSLGITNASHLMTQLPANVQVVAVSEEPAGGSPVPTTVRAVATLKL